MENFESNIQKLNLELFCSSFSEILTKLVTEAGFTVAECDYVQRETVNKKEGLSVPRIFVQGKFVKPCPGQSSTCSGHGSTHAGQSS